MEDFGAELKHLLHTHPFALVLSAEESIKYFRHSPRLNFKPKNGMETLDSAAVVGGRTMDKVVKAEELQTSSSDLTNHLAAAETHPEVIQGSIVDDSVMKAEASKIPPCNQMEIVDLVTIVEPFEDTPKGEQGADEGLDVDEFRDSSSSQMKSAVTVESQELYRAKEDVVGVDADHIRVSLSNKPESHSHNQDYGHVGVDDTGEVEDLKPGNTRKSSTQTRKSRLHLLLGEKCTPCLAMTQTQKRRKRPSIVAFLDSPTASRMKMRTKLGTTSKGR